jgi:hypothetical protein
MLKSKLLVFFVAGFKILTSPWEESCRNSQILGVSRKKFSLCKNSEKHHELESKWMVMGELQKLHKLTSLMLWKEFCCLS